jgi:hypothetical protein
MSLMKIVKVCMAVAVVVQLPVLRAQVALPPGSVDGAVNPQLIPDVVAFRLFFGALAGGASASALPQGASSSVSQLQPSARQRAQLIPVGLGAADTSLLLQAVGEWQVSVGSLPPASSGMGSAPSAPTLDTVTQATVSKLQQGMSAQEFSSLVAFVRAQKKAMKRVPVSM